MRKIRKIILSTILLLLASLLWSCYFQASSLIAQTSGTARRLAPSTFSNLGFPTAGDVRWCTNCRKTAPCSSGGTGAAAQADGSTWSCLTTGGTGTGDVSGPSAAVAGELPRFTDTSGKNIGRSNGLTGIVQVISGLVSTLSKSGNSSTVATTTGSLTSGHCPSIDSSGNLIDDNTCVNTTGAQPISNKTINGSLNILTNIGNSSLTNSSFTLGSTSISLGNTSTNITGLTLTQPTIADFTNATHVHQSNSSGGQLNASSVFNTGSVPVTRGGTGNSTPAEDQLLIGNGTSYDLKTLPACSNSSDKLLYNSTTNTFSCGIDTGGGNPGGSSTEFQFRNGPTTFGGALNTSYNSSTGQFSINQKADTNETITSTRFTDTTPTGNYLHFLNAAANTDIFKIDVTGNTSTAGSLTTGIGSSVAGNLGLSQGSSTSVVANTIQIQAPATITGYNIVLPTAAGDGVRVGSNSSNIVTETYVATTGTGNIVRSTTPTLITYYQMAEATAPSAPAADNLRIYVKDVAGISKLCSLDSASTEACGLGGSGGGTPGGSDTQIQRNNAGAFGAITGCTSAGTNITCTSANLIATSPKFITSLKDTNSNDVMGLTATASAVNNFNNANAATGSGPTLSAVGSDSNIDLNFTVKGTGTAKFNGTNAAQLTTAQSVAPTCSSNCGTSPSVSGTDTAMTVTMGASGSPASGFVVTFNGTWSASPSCTGMPALGSMVVGKLPIAIATTTTTMTVTTNGTAPANSDKYHFHCVGVQ